MSYIYLASPYTDKKALVQQDRYDKVLQVTARLLQAGIHIYSPIVHCHEAARRFNLRGDFTFWRDYNKVMLEAASGLWVLQLEGWADSAGTQWEISHATRLHYPIRLLTFPLQDIPPHA